ncbi:MAG: phosphatase PAP2 family protein [Rubrivivax sp.]|nr:phosphatase PAP2 family protein [Rubrivivax sp.]
MRVDRAGGTLALAALALLILWEWLGADLPAARLFGTAQGFALRHDWWLSAVLHDGVRDFAWVLALVLGLNVVVPLTPALTRRERLWWCAATLAGAALVPLLKQQSLTSCPWDLSEFGGLAQHLPHWRQFLPFGVADGGGGHCFPSGHATSAFCFFSGGFALGRAHPRAARRWTWAVLAAGLMLGLVQLARGAHFPSHTLWSGWLCYSLNLVLARWLPRPAAPTPVPQRTPGLGPGAVSASVSLRRPTA